MRWRDLRTFNIALTMRRKMLVLSAILLVSLAVGFITGVSRLGPVNLSPRALRIAERWTDRIGTLSDLAEEVADRTVPTLNISSTLPGEGANIGLDKAVRTAIREQIKDALRERHVKWSLSKPRELQNMQFTVVCSTTLPIFVRVRYNANGYQVFEREWVLKLWIQLEVDADRGNVRNWSIDRRSSLTTP